MEVISEIIRNVVALLLLAALLELLLPEGSTARFIRVAIGLMLTASILIPLLNAFHVSTPEADFTEDESAAAAYVEQGTELADQLNASAQSQYETELASQIASVASLAEGVASAEAEVRINEPEGTISATLFLTVKSGVSRSDTETKVRSLVGGFFLLDEKEIECIWEEAADGSEGE